MKLFSDIIKGLEWLGKEIATGLKWIPRVITITEDVGEDAATLLPQATNVLEDVDALALAAIKDGGACLASAETLTAAIVTAAKADALNIPNDEAVVAAFTAFITEVTTKSTWSDLLTAQQKLVTDWDKFGSASMAAIRKIEADAVGK